MWNRIDSIEEIGLKWSMHCSLLQFVVHTLSECSPLFLNLICSAVPCIMEPFEGHLIS